MIQPARMKVAWIVPSLRPATNGRLEAKASKAGGARNPMEAGGWRPEAGGWLSQGALARARIRVIHIDSGVPFVREDLGTSTRFAKMPREKLLTRAAPVTQRSRGQIQLGRIRTRYMPRKQRSHSRKPLRNPGMQEASRESTASLFPSSCFP
jgi:hypothetical protein